MLICAFDVDVGYRYVTLVTITRHACPACAAVKPDIHRVGPSSKIRSIISSKQFFGDPCWVVRIIGPPSFNAALLNDFDDMPDTRSRQDRFASLMTVESRDGNPPGSLARYAPFAPICDEAGKPSLPCSRTEVHSLKRFECTAPDTAYICEPLGSRPDQDWLFRPPVIWVFVCVLFLGKQKSRGVQHLQDSLVASPKDVQTK